MESSKLRILVAAFSARYALEQLVDDFASSLMATADCKVMAPTNYKGTLPESALFRISCGTTKIGGLIASVNPVTHVQVVSAMLRFRPHVVHLLSGEGYPWALTLNVARTLARLPLVVTIHDPDPHPDVLLERLNFRIRYPVLQNASVLHIYSEQYRRRVTELTRSARVEVIPHGSFASRFLAYRADGIERERLVLLFGRFQHYKGIDVLCRAMQLLPGDVRLALAGPGTLSETEQALVGELGDRVELHNSYIDDRLVAQLMQRAGVIALPYRQVTQSSIPAIANAFGLPIVASALGHFLEEIPALNGILVPPEDPAALAGALARSLSETSSAAAVVKPPPTFAELAPAFLNLYASTIGGAQRRATLATP